MLGRVTLLLALVLALAVARALALPYRSEVSPAGDGSGGPALQGATGAAGLDWTMNGRLWIADAQRRKVKYIQGGIIQTFAGTGATNLAGVADGTLAKAASFSGPWKISVDTASGDVFFTDNGKLYVIDIDDERVHPISVAGMSYIPNVLATPGALLFIDSNKVWSCPLPWNRLAWCPAPKHVAGTGTTPFNGDGLAATATNMQPVDLAREMSGAILVADAVGGGMSGRIRRFTIGGNAYTLVFGLSQATAVTAAPNGDIYYSETGSISRVSRYRNSVVSVVLGNGAKVTVPQKWCLAGTCEGVEYPFVAQDLTYDATGSALYAVDQGAGIARLDASGAVTPVATTAPPVVATSTIPAPTLTHTRTWTPLPTCLATATVAPTGTPQGPCRE